MTLDSDRRWFRFGLRTMFVVVTLVAAMASWLGWTWRRVDERRKALLNYPIYSFALNGRSEPQPKPPLLWRLLGARETHVVYMQPHATEDDIKRVQDIFPEAEIVRRP